MLVHRGTVALHTKRLLLRRLTAEDGESIFLGFGGEKSTAEFLTKAPYKNLTETEDRLSEIICSYKRKDFYYWGMEYQGEVVGVVFLSEYSYLSRRAELGWILSEKYRRLGFMREAVKEVLAFLFDGVGFSRIQAICAKENIPSYKLMESVGMKREGLMKSYYLNYKGRAFDSYIYAVTADDYKENKK